MSNQNILLFLRPHVAAFQNLLREHNVRGTLVMNEMEASYDLQLISRLSDITQIQKIIPSLLLDLRRESQYRVPLTLPPGEC